MKGERENMARWIRLTLRITGRPVFFNIFNIIALYEHETITRITTVEESDPWEVLESAETVMRMIQEAQNGALNETRRLFND